MLQDVTFWVAVAFVLFLLATLKPILRVSTTALDKRSNHIRSELAEATRLREEAQQTLAAYQQKLRDAHLETEAMLATAQETVRRLEMEAKEKLQRAIDARIALANEKILREEKQASDRIQREVVETAIRAAREMFEDDLNDEAHQKLIQLAAKDGGRLLH